MMDFHYSYDPITGRVNVPTRKTGTHNGHYLAMDFYGSSVLVHRFAWFYMTGVWPKLDVDHEDRDKLNNRWENLRELSTANNKRNGNKYKTKYPSKYIGVHQARRRYYGKLTIYYIGCVCIDYKRHFTKAYRNEDEAAIARDNIILGIGDKYARLNILIRS